MGHDENDPDDIGLARFCRCSGFAEEREGEGEGEGEEE
jgi:hypothetical protein